MMPAAIDPSQTLPTQTRPKQTRPSAAPKPRHGAGRVVLLSALGCAGLVALSAGSYAMLSGLAVPPPRARTNLSASDWPDLKDGVPALVSAQPRAPEPQRPPVVAALDPIPVAEPARLKPGAQSARDTAQAPTLAPTLAAQTPSPEALSPKEPAPKPPSPSTPIALTSPAKPMPQIAVAPVIPASRAAVIVPASRVGALVGPLRAETARARSQPSAFAALPPEPRKKVAAARAKAPGANSEASAAPEAAPAPVAEAEEAEVFGMKVPSLAPTGRKIAEAFGDAVKSLPGF